MVKHSGYFITPKSPTTRLNKQELGGQALILTMEH
jgi:hypothetical protein